MKLLVLTSTALAVSTQALIVRDAPCCFHLTASGGASGTLGQLDDGQNRIGGGLPPAQYCISSPGAITDASGRGCILTPPTTQFQCDQGASPASGFSIGCDGTISYNGNSKFFACQTGENGELNVYTTEGLGQTGCTAIGLAADGCKSGCPAPPPHPPPPKTCPTALSTGNYEFPHLIVPIDSASPDKAEGTSYSGKVSPSICSIFNFDIPNSVQGKTCSLVFLFPGQKDLRTSSYTISGSGSVDFSALSGNAGSATTYDSAPAVSQDYRSTTLAPGNSYTIATFPCLAGKTVSYKMGSSSTTFTYFQDYNPSPIGLYITTC